MNAIHGSLANFMGARLSVRQPQKVVMSCLYDKNKYEMTYEGLFMQRQLLPAALDTRSAWDKCIPYVSGIIFGFVVTLSFFLISN